MLEVMRTWISSDSRPLHAPAAAFTLAGNIAVHVCIVAMNVGSVVSYLLILTDTVSGVAGAAAQWMCNLMDSRMTCHPLLHMPGRPACAVPITSQPECCCCCCCRCCLDATNTKLERRDWFVCHSAPVCCTIILIHPGTVIPPGAEPSRNIMLALCTFAGCLPVALFGA